MDLSAYIDFGDKKTIRSKNGDSVEIPDGCSPMFPAGGILFYKIKALSKDGKHKGGQIDWGSWYVLLTKMEIKGLFAGVDISTITNHYFLRAVPFIENLPEDGLYKVVASEA
jgi:hypothetical protein